MEITNRQQNIIIQLILGKDSLADILKINDFNSLTARTIQRDFNELIKLGLVEKSGKARAVIYAPTKLGLLQVYFSEDSLNSIFQNENREKIVYDFGRLDLLKENNLFSSTELKELETQNKIYQKKYFGAPASILKREKERITIELSWKSSQIEGNTYTLLETESLLKEGVVAKGKTKDETQMILNHKKALEFSENNKDIFSGKISKSHILELHKYLAESLIDSGIRERLVGITGSVYRPLDNKHQINEELGRLCDVINSKTDVFEKALIAFVYICYLQPFNDGNKRTARILANAILNASDSFPLSLRAVDVNTYKLAILTYYELGSIGNAKRVFVDQAKYAAENYAI